MRRSDPSLCGVFICNGMECTESDLTDPAATSLSIDRFTGQRAPRWADVVPLPASLETLPETWPFTTDWWDRPCVPWFAQHPGVAAVNDMVFCLTTDGLFAGTVITQHAFI